MCGTNPTSESTATLCSFQEYIHFVSNLIRAPFPGESSFGVSTASKAVTDASFGLNSAQL